MFAYNERGCDVLHAPVPHEARVVWTEVYRRREEMIAEFSIVPIGKGESVSEFVAECIKIVEASRLEYKINPMGTVVLGDLDQVMSVILKCHRRVMELTPRAITSIKIDDRKGMKVTLDSKIDSVEKILGRKLKK